MLLGLLCQACQTRGASPPTTGPADWTPRPAPDLGPIVARVGDQPIHAAEVSAQAERARIPPAAALEELVQFALLAERAKRFATPLDRGDPTVRRLLVERLLELELEPAIARDKLPDEEIRRAYTKLEHSYVHPRLVEVALLSVYTGPAMKPEPRARARATALELHEYVKQRTPKTWEDFETIARDPAWAERKVKYWRVLQGPNRRNGPFGEKVGEPLQKLRAPNETSGLIEDDSGYHIARYIGEKPPRNVSFAEARAELAEQLYPHWRKQRFAEWTRALGAGHKIEVFPDRLR